MVSSSMIDTLLPTWHWRSRSTLFVEASPAEVLAAAEQVTVDELPGVAHRVRDAKRVTDGVTVLDELLDQGFSILHEDPAHELVLGRVGQFWRPGGGRTNVVGREAFTAFDDAGHAKALLALTATPWRQSTLLAVESRVCATDDRTAREFNRYWLVGGWASAAGRQQLLAAVRDRLGGRFPPPG